MILLYRIAFPIIALILSPYYLWRMKRRGGYHIDWQQRIGKQPTLPAVKSPRIWAQAVSVGEVNSLVPLLEELGKEKKYSIVLTTTTSTGYALAKKKCADNGIEVRLFPLDWWPFSAKAWRTINPDICFLTDSELWPEHLHQAKKRKVPVYVLNARISDRSYRRYRLLRSFGLCFFPSIQSFFASSKLDRERLTRLGIPESKIQYFGNLKSDVRVETSCSSEQLESWKNSLGLFAGGIHEPLILLGSSTWPGEEAFLIKVLVELRKTGRDWRLLLVPRHAERGPEIVELLKTQDISWHQRSTGVTPEKAVGIALADTTGELPQWVHLADMAFIGKSLYSPGGGQSPLEAAAAGVAIVMGPRMGNFKSIVESLTQSGAALYEHDERAALSSLLRLGEDQSRRRELGERARNWIREESGAKDRIKTFLLDVLNGLEGK